MNRFEALVIFSCCCILAGPIHAQDPFAAHVRTTEPLSPADARMAFRLPPGFEIQLVASEPDIFKPMNMAFDAKGRLWITESTEYPYPAPSDRPGRDNVKILDDTNGDGRADKITTFADGLNIPIGLYPLDDGAIVYSIPYIWHLRDTDGDGRADERKKLYGPMGFERDTHGMNNSFRRGFDGWLYACHGFNNETTVAGTDGHTVRMHSGNTYRMRIDGSRIEQFTWGQVNPFGMAIDPLGNLFTADCHSKPIYQLLRGGYYPSFGKPHDGLGFVPPMMDHSHNSTAIAGLAFYTGHNFPEAYRGNLFSGNVMTSRVNRNSLVYHGSTVLAKEEPDFVSTTDPWFRPVDIQVGPDGALYVADFYNRIIGHYEVALDHPGRDRHRGRIWRIVYKGNDGATKPANRPPDLTTASTEELIAAFKHPNLTYRLLAMEQLIEHTPKQTKSDEQANHVTTDLWKSLKRSFVSTKHPWQRVHLLWVLHRTGLLDFGELNFAAEPVFKLLVNDIDVVAVHAMKVLAETRNWAAAHNKLALNGLLNADAFVARAAADALGRHPQYENIQPLLELLARTPPEDTHLRHTARMALRDQLQANGSFARLKDAELSDADIRTMAGVCLALKTPEAGSFLLLVIQRSPDEPETLAAYLQHIARYVPHEETDALVQFVREHYANDVDFQWNLLASIQSGLDQRGVQAASKVREWGAALAGELLASVESDVDSPSWANTPVEGKARTDNPWCLQQRLSADGDTKSSFLTSLPRGEQATGVLRSPAFDVPAKLSFYLAGHLGFPNQPVVPKNFIRLRNAVSHELLAEATPPRNDVAQRIDWGLKGHAGKRGYLEIIDGDDAGGYAWLAVGRFDPPVVSLPAMEPRLVAERQQAAAQIAARFTLPELKPQLANLLTAESTDALTREAAARALVTIEPDSRAAALVPVVGAASVPSELRLRISQAIISRSTEALQEVLLEAAHSSPGRLQRVVAESLAGDGAGAEFLFQLVEQGRLSRRLLLARTVQDRLIAVGHDAARKRIEALTDGLPSESDALAKLIEARRHSFARFATSTKRGAEVFAKNCAACHPIDGKGPVIGPQLDGIGNRGLERLIEDVLDPNRNVDLAFRSTTLVLTNGKVHTGLFRREEGAILVLVDNKGQEFTVPAADVEERFLSNTSLMPENVAEVVPEEDFHHLLAFLLSKRSQPTEKSRQAP